MAESLGLANVQPFILKESDMASLRKRGSTYYVQFYAGRKQRRISLDTDSLQIAKEKLRQFESAQHRGEGNSLPTRTPIADIVGRYVQHIRSRKTAKSAQTDVYYLREAFGPICDELRVTSRRVTEASRKRQLLPGAVQDLRRRAQVIEAQCFEQIETAHVSAFITGQVQRRGLAPKTANRYREILCRLFNWAMDEGGVKMPSDKNPVAKVGRYKEHAPDISFLTLRQIDEQLQALKHDNQMQTMVAVLIYAGLRREELLWLTHDDVDLKAGTFGTLRIRAKTIDDRSWQPKTARNRAVPIGSTLRRYLDAYTRRIVPGGWLFPSPNGTGWDPDNFSHDLADANRSAGLQWSCLDYRHTFGTQLAMKGESLYKIATLMGNSPEICRRHYAALLPEALGDSVEFATPACATSA